MAGLDSVANFIINEEFSHAHSQNLKTMPRITKKEAQIVVNEPEDSDVSKR